MSRTHKSNQSKQKHFKETHRFEHWYRDHQVYFITARVAHRLPAFASESAKQLFWSAFDHYTTKYSFTPWITSLLDNHYHTLGYLETGLNLPKMMKGIHGSVAKQVNDLLESQTKAGGLQSPRTHSRILSFWSESGTKTYFDGCIRDESQARKTYRYIQIQPHRHRALPRHVPVEHYPHTHTNITLDEALAFARAHRAYLEGVPYKRYASKGGGI